MNEYEYDAIDNEDKDTIKNISDLRQKWVQIEWLVYNIDSDIDLLMVHLRRYTKMRDLARVDFENLNTFTNEIIKLTTKLNVCKDVVVEDVKNYVK